MVIVEEVSLGHFSDQLILKYRHIVTHARFMTNVDNFTKSYMATLLLFELFGSAIVRVSSIGNPSLTSARTFLNQLHKLSLYVENDSF